MRFKCSILIFLLFCNFLAKSETFSIGSYIINMGVTPQTVGNGMKPYGLVYEFLKTYQIPIKWVIRSGKSKDSADFTYNGTQYKGGTFIVPKEYINSTIKSRITYWKGQGVVMDSITSALTVTVTRTLTSAPRWTISTVNTSMATDMLTYAGIPSSSYNTNAPSSLGTCDDIFAMPHADPTWALHGNLYDWNRTYKGSIWAMCHAVSVLEGLVNPSNSAERMNFLSTQGLINYASHANGTPAYKYFFNRGSYNGAPISASADDPVFQMMGIEDAAHTNGSEQIYIPLSGSGSGWRNTTKIGCYDSTQSNVTSFPNGPAAVTLYGRGFGLSTAGYVMYQSGHDIAGTSAAEVSAMRQFLNFSLMSVGDKTPTLTSSNIAGTIQHSTSNTFSVTATSPLGSALTYQWTSSCAGTFSSPNSATTDFTITGTPSNLKCIVTCLITDACGRTTFLSSPIQVLVSLPVKLISFDGEPEMNNVRLKWVSASEDKLLSYELLRSNNGDDFQSIAVVYPTVNQSGLKEYSYTDLDLNESGQTTVYYKLKMIDEDGSSTYGPVIDIDRSNSGAGIRSILPNPSSDVIYIELETAGNQFSELQITDVYGRIVFETNEFEMLHSKQIKLKVDFLKNGIYFIVLKRQSGANAKAMFLKN